MTITPATCLDLSPGQGLNGIRVRLLSVDRTLLKWARLTEPSAAAALHVTGPSHLDHEQTRPRPRLSSAHSSLGSGHGPSSASKDHTSGPVVPHGGVRRRSTDRDRASPTGGVRRRSTDLASPTGGVLIGELAAEAHGLPPLFPGSSAQGIDMLYLSQLTCPGPFSGAVSSAFCPNSADSFLDRETQVKVQVRAPVLSGGLLPYSVAQKIVLTSLPLKGFRLATLEGLIAIALCDSFGGRKRSSGGTEVVRLLVAYRKLLEAQGLSYAPYLAAALSVFNLSSAHVQRFAELRAEATEDEDAT